MQRSRKLTSFLSFLLAPIQTWWYHWHGQSNGGSTITSDSKTVIGGSATPVGLSATASSGDQSEDPLNGILDKFKELPKTDRPSIVVGPPFEYIEPTTDPEKLVRRLHKLLNRYGFHLVSVQYNVKHDADRNYYEDFILNIHRLHRDKSP